MGVAEKSSLMVAAVVVPLLQKERRSRTERRRRNRVKLSLPARFRPFDPRYGQLEEVQMTVDFTRNGLYFTTWLEHYHPGMRVLVTFPYCSVARVRRDYLGCVVRVERLPDGHLGIAVRFLF